MRNVKLIIEYDGTRFHGWQIQVKDRTVQAELERSLSMLTDEQIRVTAAGRTDAGVHALGQVVNFKTASLLSLDSIMRGGNSRLPQDVRIRHAEEVPPDFNARYSAKSREYRYHLTNEAVAINRFYVWQYWRKFDIERMQQAAEYIVGTHDFETFCQVGSDVSHHLCNVHFARWKYENDQYVFEIKANRFLHNMVRILVGTMVEIGTGRFEPQDIQNMLAAKDRQVAGNTAPAVGLFLLNVEY